MSKFNKLILKILSGESDKNLNFDEICNLLQELGWELRIKGSHHIFVFKGRNSIINLQRDGKNIKVYQVKQLRNELLKLNLNTEIND